MEISVDLFSVELPKLLLYSIKYLGTCVTMHSSESYLTTILEKETSKLDTGRSDEDGVDLR